METVESDGGQSEELSALGPLPSEAELRALIERYAGASRVTCEIADEFLASVGEVLPARPLLDPRLVAREVEEVAGGSWLEKIGSGSSAPPRARSVPASRDASAPRARRSSIPPVLSITPVPPGPEPVSGVSVEEALEHLPAATYSSLPPARALPSQDSAPIALPLSSRPPHASLPPSAAASEAVSVEQWGPAASSEAASEARAASPSHVPPLPRSAAPEGALALDARSSRVPPLPGSSAAEGGGSVEARSSSVPPLPGSSAADGGRTPDARSSRVPLLSDVAAADSGESLYARSSRVPPLPRSAAPEGGSALDRRSSSVPPLPPSAALWGDAGLDRRSSSVPPLPPSAALRGDAGLERRSSSVPPLPRSAEPEGARLDARASSVPPLPHSVAPVGSAVSEGRLSSRVPPLPRTAASDAPAGNTLPPARTAEEALLSAEEDALLDQWSDDVDKALPSAASQSDVAPGADEPEPWNAELGASSRRAAASQSSSAAPPIHAEREDDAPLSAAELSLLDRWSPAAPDVPTFGKPESAITGGFEAADYAAAVYAPSDARTRKSSQPPPRLSEQPAPSAIPAARRESAAPAITRPPAFPSGRPVQPIPSSRPPVPAAALAASMRPVPPIAAVSGEPDEADLDVEEIELDPDDLIEVDNE